MTVNTTKITGFVVLPNDTIREQSKVIFTMTGFDTDADDDATVVPIPIEAPIAVDGSIDVDMWPNPEGVRTTFYRVTFSIYNGNKPILVDGGLISVPVSGGPYDLNDLLPVSPPSGATVEEYIAQLAAAVASAEAAADAADNEKFRFASRSQLATWWSANPAPPDGVVLSDGDVEYVASVGATAISDLSGLLPFGEWDPQHFGVSPVRNRAPFHPLGGTSSVIHNDRMSHPWLQELFFHSNTNETFMVYKDAHRHEQSYSAPIVLARSIDLMGTIEERKTIFSRVDYDVADTVGGTMDSNRIGLLFSVRNSANDFIHYFSYSDDDGVSFTNVEGVFAASAKFFPYGELISAPAAATGLGSDGYAVFGYGVGGIQIAYTIDNGATWTNSVVVATGAGSTTSAAEPFVLRLGSENKWIMFLRDGTGTMSMSTSTDLLTWSTPVDTTVQLGANPVFAVYDGGAVYVYITSRNNASRLDDRNVVYMIRESADTIWAAGNLTEPNDYTPVIHGDSQVLGYFQAFERNGEWIYAWNEAEVEQGSGFASSCAIVVGATSVKSVASPSYARSASPNENILDNPYFQDWTRSTSIAVSGVTKVCSRWVCSPSGATGTVSRSALSDTVSRLTPWNGRYGMGVSLTANDFISFYQVLAEDPNDDGEGIIRKMSDQIYTMSVWGVGAVPTGFNCAIQFNYGSGGSATATRTFNIRSYTGTDVVWYATGTVRSPAIDGVTIGTDPKVIFSIGATGNDVWECTLLGAKLELGDVATPMEPEHPSESQTKIGRYLRKLEYGQFDHIASSIQRTTGQAEAVITTPGMFAVPSVTWSGAASDLQLLSSDGSLTPTSVSFPSISRDNFTMQLDNASLTFPGAAIVRKQTAGSHSILLDAEPT